MAAFAEFKKGKRHKAEVALFELTLEENIFELHEKLLGNNYIHGSYCKFRISDPKPRIIHKATVKDRVVHQAIYRVLYPIFNKSFIYDSYSSRVGKGTHKAVQRLETFVKTVSQSYRFTCCGLKLDIKKFFDSIDHQILKNIIKRKIKCLKTLNLIDKIIDSFEVPLKKGLPLGNVTSQLFANIYLNELDRFVKTRLKIKYYLRFCDDFIFVLKNNKFNNQFDDIKTFLSDNLLLGLKSNTLNIRKLRWGLDYLGFVILPHHKIMRLRSQKRMLSKIAGKRQKLQKNFIAHEELTQSINSYLGHLKHCNGFSLAQKILNS